MSQLIISSAQAVSSLVAGNAGQAAGRALASGLANTVANLALQQAQTLIFGPAKRRVEGPRLESLRLQASSEGAPLPVVYGRVRIAGQVIWASRFREEINTQTSGGGKGGRPSVETTATEYLYSISLAIGLCEGEIDRIGRVWADGKLLNLQDFTTRLYTGSEDQLPDSVIEAVEGAGLAPAYRGLAYIVFEDLPLRQFGNRIPQFSFEVERALRDSDPAMLENAIEAVTMIPGSGEAAYATTPVVVTDGEGTSRSENVHNASGGTDFVASVRALGETLPACRHVALIVSWFGTDLRPGFCEIVPGVETEEKETHPLNWSVSGLSREEARLISQIDGAPAYGGTPSDQSVIEAIRHLKDNGYKVLFYPFVLMDIPPGNQLPDPDGGVGQPAFPWRGRIRPGGDDKSAAARTQVENFFGTAAAGAFTVNGETVSYAGTDGFSFRRMILHYAHLCEAAGGVDSFLIGSELRGLTTARDETDAFPAVEQLQNLATDVRSIVGTSTEISYAADWSEYFGHQPADGSGDVFFHLDSLWAHGEVDFIGIDNYMPLADWRDGKAHLDALAGAPSIYNLAYLQGNIAGGEGFDWFYASDSDRDNQLRTPVSDGAHGEDWIFRYKDLVSWWQNSHHDRPGGVRSQTPTVWQPESKPIVFTELGCAAMDKAANQPNIFFDPKSAESGTAHYSSGRRDDLMQRRFLEAHLGWWQDPAHNPVSAVYAGPMLNPERLYIYTWDARPFPDFPARETVWADAENWLTGHWLTGRVGRVPLDVLVNDITARGGFSDPDTERLEGLVTGYMIDRPMSMRAALEPLTGLYQFDAVESGDVLRFVPRSGEAVLTLSREDLVADDLLDYQIVQAQAADLPAAFDLLYLDDTRGYETAAVEARQPGSTSQRRVMLDTAIVLDAGEAEGRAAALLNDALVMGQMARFSLPPSQLSLEPSDVVTLQTEGSRYDLRLTELLDGEAREVTAVRTSDGPYDVQYGTARPRAEEQPAVYGPPVLELLDLPLLDEGAPVIRAAAYASPWPGGIALYRQPENGAPVLEEMLRRPAILGRLTNTLAGGPVSRWDRGSRLEVSLSAGALQAVTESDVLNGANLAAVETISGDWEILQYRAAMLDETGSWVLSDLLRGLAGTEVAAEAGAAADARFVLLDGAPQTLPVTAETRLVEVTRLAGPFQELVSSQNFISRTDSFAGLGFRPLSPVHLKAAAVSGGIQLNWIRRTRSGGDSWTGEDVPLGETEEKYEIDILDGGTVLRTLTSGTNGVFYSDADMETDFGPGGPGGVLSVSVSQMSEVFGRGVAGRADLDL